MPNVRCSIMWSFSSVDGDDSPNHTKQLEDVQDFTYN